MYKRDSDYQDSEKTYSDFKSNKKAKQEDVKNIQEGSKDLEKEVEESEARLEQEFRELQRSKDIDEANEHLSQWERVAKIKEAARAKFRETAVKHQQPSVDKKAFKFASGIMELIVRNISSCHSMSYSFDNLRECSLPNYVNKNIVFITGNNNKLKEVSENLCSSINLTCKKIDLKETQHSNVLDIAQDKCLEALGILNQNSTSSSSILIEDTSLHFDALNGMPGPYIKWFLEAVGPEGLNRMLEGFINKSARAVCTYALMSDKNEILFFQGVCKGNIVKPRGDKGWGWDSCFEESNSKLTFGEMDAIQKHACSHRYFALKLLSRFFSRD